MIVIAYQFIDVMTTILVRFNLPRQIYGTEWQTEKRPPLPVEQQSTGCVGNTDTLVCPAFNSPRDDYSR